MNRHLWIKGSHKYVCKLRYIVSVFQKSTQIVCPYTRHNKMLTCDKERASCVKRWRFSKAN